MKITMPAGNWTFTPGAPGVGEIDFSIYPGFVQENLYAVINTSATGNPIIFSTSGGAALGGVFSGGTKLYPNYDTSSMSSGDTLQVIYDDPTFAQTITGSVAVDTIPNTIMGYGVVTGPLQGAAGNTYLDGSSSLEVMPYRSFYAQIIADSVASGHVIFEGSNNNSDWNTIYVNQVNSTAEVLTSAIPITASTRNTYSGAVNFRYMRARSPAGFGAGKIQIFSVFSQSVLTLPIPNTQLVDSAGRALNYGAGLSSGSTLRVVTSDDSQVIGRELHITSGSFSASGINLMTGTSASYDVTGYKSIAMQIVGSAGITGGAVIWEGSNDNVNWNTQILIPPDNSTPSPVTSAQTIGAGVVRQLCASLPFRYYRLRISTGFTGGTVSAQFRLSPNHYTGMAIPVIGTVSAAVTGATLASTQTTDIAAANINTTTTSGVVATTSTHAMCFQVNVTAVSGTNPTCDIVLQESHDGSNFFDVFHFERITTTGLYYTPTFKITGSGFRIVRTLGGTGPNFNMNGIRVSRSVDAPILRRFFNRTIDVNALNSTTSAFLVDGCDEYTLTVNMGAITTTAPIFQLEGSEDATNWFSIGTTLTSVANSTVSYGTGSVMSVKWIRARVSTAGSGATLGYVCIRGKNT